MSTINYVIGDATLPSYEPGGNLIIAHICNNRGGWGAGFTTALSARWIQPEVSYRNWYRCWARGMGYPFELGMLQIVPVHTQVRVANMIAQDGYASPEHPVAINYSSLGKCLAKLRRSSQIWDYAIVHMPRIGCGLAGGSWGHVSAWINESLVNHDVTVYVYDLPKK